METKILEGKSLSKSIMSGLPARVEASKQTGRPPSLAAVNCYEDPASQIYIKRKLSACQRLGISAQVVKPEKNEDFGSFIELIKRLNSDPAIDAIMIERPLPQGYACFKTWETLSPEKDADGASAMNMGRLFLCKNFSEIEEGGFFTPCTAMAVIKLLREHKLELAGKRVSVMGRSSIVGRPLAHMLSCLDATVTLCHSRTRNLTDILKNSEVVISAVGKPRWITSSMISPGAVVVDVGTNTDSAGKFCGDVDFEDVKPGAGHISPVPGGVGPVTLACLLENTVKAAESGGRLNSTNIL